MSAPPGRPSAPTDKSDVRCIGIALIVLAIIAVAAAATFAVLHVIESPPSASLASTRRDWGEELEKIPGFPPAAAAEFRERGSLSRSTLDALPAETREAAAMAIDRFRASCDDMGRSLRWRARDFVLLVSGWMALPFALGLFLVWWGSRRRAGRRAGRGPGDPDGDR